MKRSKPKSTPSPQKKTVRKKKVLAIPKGYNSITPYLIVKNAAKALDFYKKAFDAKVLFKHEMGKRIGHAELKIGDSKIMLADEFLEMDAKGPESVGGTPVSIHLYVKQVDKVVPQAKKAGATILHPLENKFYGDRSAMLKDPFGHIWCISTHVEDISLKELKKRAEQFKKEHGMQ